MHPRIAELTEYLARTRASLEDTVAALAPEAAARRPAADAWSPAEVVDHLARVERSIIRLLSKLVARGVEEGIGPEDSVESVVGRLDRYRLSDAQFRRVESPERLRPTPAAELGPALGALREARAELHRLLAAADGMALGRLKAPHQAVGELDFYEWVLFLAQHEERHRRQIAAAAAPRPDGTPSA